MWACRARQRCVAAPRCKHALHTCTACASALAWTFPHPRLRARQPLCSPRSRTRVRARTRTDAGASGAHKLVAGALGTLVSRSRSAPRRPGRAVEALGVSRQRPIYRHVSLCACSICCMCTCMYTCISVYMVQICLCVRISVCMHARMHVSIDLSIHLQIFVRPACFPCTCCCILRRDTPIDIRRCEPVRWCLRNLSFIRTLSLALRTTYVLVVTLSGQWVDWKHVVCCLSVCQSACVRVCSLCACVSM